MGIEACAHATMEAKVSAPAPLRLRPLEIGDLLDETFRIYRRHFVLFAGISLILAIPSAGLTGYSIFSLFSSFVQSANSTAPDFSGLVSSMALLVIGYLVILLLSPFTSAAAIYAACESAQGRPATICGALHGDVRRHFRAPGCVLRAVLSA